MSLRAPLPIVAVIIALSASVASADEPIARMSLWEVTETVIEHPYPHLARDTPAGTMKVLRYCQPDSSPSDLVLSLGLTHGVTITATSAQRLTQQPGRRSLQSVFVADPRARYLAPWQQFDSFRGAVLSDKRDDNGDFKSDFTTERNSIHQTLERGLPEGEPIRERKKAHAKRLGDCPPGTPPGPIKDPVTDGRIDPSRP